MKKKTAELLSEQERNIRILDERMELLNTIRKMVHMEVEEYFEKNGCSEQKGLASHQAAPHRPASFRSRLSERLKRLWRWLLRDTGGCKKTQN